jgi:hypothetical protein
MRPPLPRGPHAAAQSGRLLYAHTSKQTPPALSAMPPGSAVSVPAALRLLPAFLAPSASLRPAPGMPPLTWAVCLLLSRHGRPHCLRLPPPARAEALASAGAPRESGRAFPRSLAPVLSGRLSLPLLLWYGQSCKAVSSSVESVRCSPCAAAVVLNQPRPVVAEAGSPVCVDKFCGSSCLGMRWMCGVLVLCSLAFDRSRRHVLHQHVPCSSLAMRPSSVFCCILR